MSEADRQEDNKNDSEDDAWPLERDHGPYDDDEEIERLEVAEQVHIHEDLIPDQGIEEHRNEDAWQVTRNVTPHEHGDSHALGDEDFLQLIMDFEEDEERRIWMWINRNPDLNELATRFVENQDLVPKPTEKDVKAFQEEFGRDLKDFLESERQRHVGQAMQNNSGGMPSHNSFSTCSTSQSETEQKGKRPDKYTCGICKQLKKDARTGRSHVCRPTRQQIIEEIMRRLKKDTKTRPQKRTKLGRSDSIGSKEGYKCNNCGKPKKGHICQVPDVIGRIAQRIMTTEPDSVDESMIKDAIDNEEGLVFSADDERLIVNTEIAPLRDTSSTDQRPGRLPPQATENMLLLQRRDQQQTNDQELKPPPDQKDDQSTK